MYQHLEIEREGAIARLWLNRPERLNALGTTTLRELRNAAHAFNDAPEVRAVIVGGRGRAFCAGADLEGFPPAAEALESMTAVTVARVNGWCVGGGLVLAAACDLRVAEHGARFSIPEIDLGIPLAWGGIPRLVREIGPALTRELVITCREFGAEEAHRAGFLNRIVAPEQLDDEVETLARTIAAKPALPVTATKRHVDAITAQMLGTGRSWADADGLVTGLQDPECIAARNAYIAARR